MSVYALAILAAFIGWLIGSAWVAQHEMHEQAERDMQARRAAFRIEE